MSKKLQRSLAEDEALASALLVEKPRHLPIMESLEHPHPHLRSREQSSITSSIGFDDSQPFQGKRYCFDGTRVAA